ncbi:MAG: sulfotransferase domain-containing protein, partial [Sulfuricellaceae bacterium]|nr:sulfotransferase domain-containing protein [Sulfuricellaceae bacterium]
VRHHLPIEVVADNPAIFKTLVTYLTRNRVKFDRDDLDRAYSMRHTLFRGEAPVECEPAQLMQSWPGWKVDAFRKLVSAEAIDIYSAFGYDLKEITRHPVSMTPAAGKISRPVFVSSIPKSGTWLLRDILEMMTGLKAYEPTIGEGTPDYADANLIEFPSGTFFSWHSVLTPQSISLLKGCQARNIFLIRNIYDVLLSMHTHLSRDVDAAIGRSIVGSDYFDGKTIEQCLSLMISGFTSPKLTWTGVIPLIQQMDSMLELAESGDALLLSYEQLTVDKCTVMQKIMQALGLQLPQGKIDEIVAATGKEAMRERKKAEGQDQHIPLPEHRLSRSAFQAYHKEMIDLAIFTYAPKLPERLAALGFDSTLRLTAEANP